MSEVLAGPDELVVEIMATPEGRRDPYPRYQRLREAAPVHRSALGGVWFLSRYDDCRFVLRDNAFGKHPDGLPPLFGADRSDVADAVVGFRGASMLTLNPPAHTRLRGLVSREFTPRRVDALRPDIQRLLAPLLDRMAADGETDAMDALAFRLPIAVIGELVGVPQEHREQFRSLVRATAALIEPFVSPDEVQRAVNAQQEMVEYFLTLIAHKRRDPGPDLLSALIAVEAEGDRLNEDELVANTILLFAAGFETTTNLIGNGLLTLLRQPDQLARLRANPSLIPAAVEEILRYESPVQLDARYVFDDMEIGGHRLPAGDTVITFLGAANRDPDQFDEADHFDISRAATPPLSFGSGIHHCLGAYLARAEGQEVFGALLSRFSSIELLDPDAHWRPGLTLRGLERLDVRVHAR